MSREALAEIDPIAAAVSALDCFDFVEFDGQRGHVTVVCRVPEHQWIEFKPGEAGGDVQWGVESVEVRGYDLLRVKRVEVKP